MKKRNSLFFIMTCLVIMGCRHHQGGGLSIEFNNTRHHYSMKAWFNANRTEDVEHYMDKILGNQSNMSFVHSRIDGRLSFDDHTNFYIKKYPGYLHIKLDKEQNSDESNEKIQHMCEGIKEILLQPASNVEGN